MDNPTNDAEIRAHADLVYRTCRRLTGNDQDAADVSQEVFIAWMQSRGTIRGPLGAWLHGTARQRALDFLRRSHNRIRHERQSLPMSASDSESDPAWGSALDEALADLDGTSRALVIEHHLMGVDQVRLAARFRCTQATVSRRLAKALGQLRVLLERRGVTAASSAIPPILAKALAQPPCPADLVAPVLAHAHVAGAASILGPACIGIAWTTWIGYAGTVLFALAALATGEYWWWRADVMKELDKDWTALATANLPPVAIQVAAPVSGNRYPSIEAFIARLPVVDAVHQARVNKLIQPEGEKPWAHFAALTTRFAIDRSDPKPPLSAAQREAAQTGYALMKPFLIELVSGDALIGPAATLADDYVNGRLATWALRKERWTGSLKREEILSRMMSILIDRVEMSDPNLEALGEYDALVAARDRSITSLIDGLTAANLHARRDLLYLRLIYAHRVSDELARRWCSETSPFQGVTERAYRGEVLLMALPILDDFRQGRSTGSHLEEFGPFSSLDMMRQLAWLPERFSTLDSALRGATTEDFRHISFNQNHLLAPVVRVMLSETAKNTTAHHARRRAAELLLDAHAGKPLPESTPKPTSSSVDAWQFRYERLSSTRFRLVIDPSAGSPAYCNDSVGRAPETTLGNPSSRPRDPGFEDHGAGGIEIEVPPASATVPLPVPDHEEEEPVLPSAFQ